MKKKDVCRDCRTKMGHAGYERWPEYNERKGEIEMKAHTKWACGSCRVVWMPTEQGLVKDEQAWDVLLKHKLSEAIRTRDIYKRLFHEAQKEVEKMESDLHKGRRSAKTEEKLRLIRTD